MELTVELNLQMFQTRQVYYWLMRISVIVGLAVMDVRPYVHP